MQIEVEAELIDVKLDLSELMQELAAYQLESTQENFDAGGRPVPWLPVKRPSPFGIGPLHLSGRLRESGRIESGPDFFEVIYGTGLEYAQIHNAGGVTHPRVTPQSRKFFWAMFYETDDEMWKWLALTKKQQLTISIPARQFNLFQEEDLEYHAKKIGESFFKVSTNLNASVIQ